MYLPKTYKQKIQQQQKQWLKWSYKVLEYDYISPNLILRKLYTVFKMIFSIHV